MSETAHLLWWATWLSGVSAGITLSCVVGLITIAAISRATGGE